MTGDRSLAEQGHVKVRTSDDDGFTETAWAVRVAPGTDHFRLDNSPFYAYRVSTDDVVEGQFVAEGFYDFVRVVERSGNRTVRLMFEDEKADTPTGKRVLDGVVALGCSYEGMFNTVMSITVPPTVNLNDVARYLTSTGLRWEYADPTYRDLFGDE
jgi:hypothetical protein